MRAHVTLLAALVCASVVGLSLPGRAAPPTHEDASPSFGPFDAGPRRAVTRQGTPGKTRAQHPAVGDAAHLPGSGPPPPSLQRDPLIPETLVDVNTIGDGLTSNPLALASLVYANFITRVDGPRCQHLPTCSRFASQAVARHGALGVVIGLDRLIQPTASSSLRPLPTLQWRGQTRHYDPLENYEFWAPGRFTGFPPPTSEEPLALLPLPASSSSSSPSPSSSSSPSSPSSSSSSPSPSPSPSPPAAP